MNYEQIFFYYKNKDIFDFDKTVALLDKSNYSIKNPETQLITILQRNGDSVVERKRLQELFINNEFFSILLWINSIDCITWSFGYEEKILSQTFNVTNLRFDQVEQTSTFFLDYALNELIKNSHNFLGFGMDLNGSCYDYDFDFFFSSREEILPLKYIPDILFFAKDKEKQIFLNDTIKTFKIAENHMCIVKNQKLSNYLESLT